MDAGLGPSHRSILDRLKNSAHQRGRPVAELHELYAIERFLHRLGRSRYRDDFVLKGGLLLRQWLGQDTRPTRDVDLLGPAELGAEALRIALLEILGTEADPDGIEYTLGSIVVQPIRTESAVVGLRAKFDATLGRTRLRYQVDVGLGDTVFPPPEEIIPGGLLGLPMASVRAYTPYTTVAEKLEATVYHGASNSRMKDYYDLWRLPEVLAFDGPVLVEAVRRTFQRRAVAIPACPLDGLCDGFAEQPITVTRWRSFLKRSQLPEPAGGLPGVVTSIRAFAEPVLDAARSGMPCNFHWLPGGPWQAAPGVTQEDAT